MPLELLMAKKQVKYTSTNNIYLLLKEIMCDNIGIL